MVEDYSARLGNCLPISHVHWSHRAGTDLLGHLSAWFPPPELARQCLIQFLELWVESPQTTGALFFIPRTLAHCWLGLSRHIRLVDTIYPSEVRLRHPPLLPIPILVLYISPHSPSLPVSSSVGTHALPKGFRWHNREAARMRELPRANPPGGPPPQMSL